jgi:hypothetical protein
MATSAQIAANRENAKKSTGPQTEAGRQASSHNAVRHGLSGHAFALLDWESAEDFDTIKAFFETRTQAGYAHGTYPGRKDDPTLLVGTALPFIADIPDEAERGMR